MCTVLFLSKTQTATLKVQTIFNVPERTSLCIFRSMSVLLPPTSSRIVTSSSRDHPPRKSIMMFILLHLVAWELLPQFPAKVSVLKGILLILSFSIVNLRATHFQSRNSLALMIYNTCIHPIASETFEDRRL